MKALIALPLLLAAGCGRPPVCSDGTFVGDVFIDEQGDVDALAGCTAIVASPDGTGGNLQVGTSAGPRIIIYEPQVPLTSLRGLEALAHLDGVLTIDGTDLVDLEGLSGLESVGGIEVANNARLESLAGLDVTTICIEDLPCNGSVAVIGNAALTRLGGLDALTEIPRDLRIEGNPTLAAWDGLGAVQQIGNSFVLEGSQLRDLDGLAALDAISVDLALLNTQLIDVDSLERLTSLAGVNLTNNPALSSLAGLRNLGVVGNLSVTGALPAGLRDLTGLTEISSVLAVLETPLEALGGPPALTAVRGTLHIGRTQLTSLGGLSTLQRVGTLHLHENPRLADLRGLEALTAAGAIDLGAPLFGTGPPLPDGLISLEGLNGLRRIDGAFSIRETRLRDLSALAQLEVVAGTLSIGTAFFQSFTSPCTGGSPTTLTTLTGLEGLQRVGSGGVSVALRCNPALADISALTGAALNGSVVIEGNPALSSCAATALAEAAEQTCTCEDNGACE